MKKTLARRNCYRKNLVPPHDKLHIGCGRRLFQNWTNTDVYGSDLNLDLSRGKLPWKSDSFRVVLSQHVIEHLELFDELFPLLSEIHRVLAPDGCVWLSCPDMSKVCHGYINDGGVQLLESIKTRHNSFSLGERVPVQQVVNHLFHQYGEHKNLFDFELLSWVLKEVGFSTVEQQSEPSLLASEPDVEARLDDDISLYVCAKK